MAGNDRSKNITQGVARSPNRSMYYAMGYQKSDFELNHKNSKYT